MWTTKLITTGLGEYYNILYNIMIYDNDDNNITVSDTIIRRDPS